MPIQTSSITTSTNGDLSLDPNGTGKVKLTDLAGTSTEQLAVDSSGNVEKLNAGALPVLDETDTGDTIVVQAGSARGTVVLGDIYGIDARSLGGPSSVDPDPTQVTAVPAFVGGDGSQSNPYIISPAAVSLAGGSATSAQLITVTSARVGAILIKDISSGDANGKFVQPPHAIFTPGGSTSFNLVYNDTPSTPVGQGQTYDGLMQLGATTVYFAWAVSQASNASAFGPTGAPTASPATVDFAGDGKYGTVSTTWADGSVTLQNTDSNLVFSVNNGAFDDTSKTVSDGDLVKVAFDAAVVNAAAEGATVTGVLESTTGSYYSPFSIVKDTVPGQWIIPAINDQATSSVVTSFGPAPDAYNCPSTVTSAVGGSTPLTSIQVSVGGGGFTSVLPITINPGDLISVRGTTGGAANTVYSAVVTIGGVAATFSVTTGATATEIVTPQIISPPNFGGVEQAEDVTITSSPIDLIGGGSVTHASSSWEAYKALPGASPLLLQTDTITAVSVAGSTSTLTLASNFNLASFQAGNSVRQSSTYQPVTSTIANIAPANYSSDFTSSVVRADRAFDGGFSQYAYAGEGKTGTLVLDFTNDPIPYNKFRIYIASSDRYETSYSINGGATVNAPYTTNSGGWLTLEPSSGVLTTFSVTSVYSGSDNQVPRLYALEIDDVILRDGDPVLTFASPNPDFQFFKSGDIVQTGVSIVYANTVNGKMALSGGAWTGADGTASGTPADRETKVTCQSPLKQGIGTLSSVNTGTNQMVITGVTSEFIPNTNSGSGTGTPTTFKVEDPTIPGIPVAPSTEPPGANYQLVEQDLNDTTNLTSWAPTAGFELGSTNFVRVKYTDTTPVSSEYSDWSGFDVQSVLEPGQPYKGGYFGGQINVSGTVYNLVAAPLVSGSLQGQYGGATPQTIVWKTTFESVSTPSSDNEAYGLPAQTANSSTAYPMWNWVTSNATGPNAGTFDASNAAGTGIGGFNDWYIPAKNELAILYFFLKPTGTPNTLGWGENENYVSPYPTYPTGYSYGSNPRQTTASLFQDGGSQAFASDKRYWSATEYTTVTSAWSQYFDTGVQADGGKDTSTICYARAIRRVAA